MKVNTKQFAAAVRNVGVAVPRRPSTPILSSVVVSSDGEALVLGAFDYETSVTIRVPADGAAEFEPRLVEYDRLKTAMSGMSKKVKDTTEIGWADGGLQLAQGGFSAMLPNSPYRDMADYPTLPTVEGEKFVIDSAVLLDVAEVAAVTAGRDDMLPVLTGVHFRLDGNSLKANSTDRFRMCEVTDTVQRDGGPAEFLFPATVLLKVAKMLDGDVAVVHKPVGNDGFLSLSTDTVHVTQRLIGGEFPKVDSLWPTEAGFEASFDADDLLAAVEPFKAIRGESITVNFGADSIAVSDADETGRSVAPGKTETPVIAGFNPKFLHQILRSMKGQRVTVTNVGDPCKPFVFNAADWPGARYLLMPRRLLSGANAAA